MPGEGNGWRSPPLAAASVVLKRIACMSCRPAGRQGHRPAGWQATFPYTAAEEKNVWHFENSFCIRDSFWHYELRLFSSAAAQRWKRSYAEASG